MLGFGAMDGLDESAISRSVKSSPLPPLAAHVRYVRAVPRSELGSHYVRLPDGELELFLHVNATATTAHVSGTRATALDKVVTSRAEHTYVVRFKPGGAYPFFGIPVSELTDRIVPLDDLWGT